MYPTRCSFGMIVMSILCASSVAHATDAVFVGDRKSPVSEVTEKAHWEGQSLPTRDDVATIRATGMLKGSLDVMALRVRSPLFINGRLTVSQDVSVSSKLEAQSGSVRWNGPMTVSCDRTTASLAILNSFREEDDRETRIEGESIRFGPRSQLQFRCFYGLPDPVGQGGRPLLVIRQSLSFDGSASVSVNLEGEIKKPLKAGEFLLVQAGEFTGDLPTLEVKGIPASTNLKASLKRDGGKLLLVLAAP